MVNSDHVTPTPASHWSMLQVLLNRNYRGDIDNSVIDSFISLVNEVEDESLARPPIKTNDCTFAYIKVNIHIDHKKMFYLQSVTLVRSLFSAQQHLHSGHQSDQLQRDAAVQSPVQGEAGHVRILQGGRGGEHQVGSQSETLL